MKNTLDFYKKICDTSQNCKILKTDTGTSQEIKIAILKKAAAIKKNVAKKKDG